jgi:hypothetical protein
VETETQVVVLQQLLENAFFEEPDENGKNLRV